MLSPVVKQIVSKSSLAKQFEPLQDVAAKIVKERKEAKTRSRKDFLQFLIDSKDDSTTDGTIELTEEEIIATILVVVLSGIFHHFTYILYLLALHPNVQEKLIAEIRSYFDANPDATLYDAAENIEYAEMILREVFRLYPAINIIFRVCSQTCMVGDGIMIPKDTVVYIPVHNLHRNPDYWPDPEKFDPERFSRNPKVPYNSFAFVPFGEGPRMCPGKRLAHVKIKMAIIHLLRDYKFVRAADTEVPLEVENHFKSTQSGT